MRELLAYSQGAVVEEKLALRIRANNDGDIYLPTAGYGPEGVQNCDYDWKVSIDGGEETTYKGLGSSNGAIRVGYGLNPLSVHTVIIKPNEERYGWLRAFGYKGTNYANSLINIVSDKSYKGYAVSDMFCGDYFKAYQYYGCENLINTDEELLPDTLQIIGDYYRYYEYAGCVSLVSNAEERVLKTVKAIGNYYRAYQYNNCKNINKINMRAINRASVGNNYRYNQYLGIGTDRKQVSIYIEGGIEEGGDWGLINNNVKGIYVYKDLVSDYQAKLSSITSSKIQKNSALDNNNYEFIEIIAIADSTGKIRIPIGGFSTTMSQDCAYDWMISIDGGEAVEYTGTGDDSYISIGSGLIEGTEHRVIIEPKTVGYGWGRAFGYFSTGAEAYIKELIHDSYKCYAVSRVDTGAHYKHATYVGCTNLINSYEKLPTSVTTVGDYYMKECYAGCTSLANAFWEVVHDGATIGSDYRYHEYTGCTALSVYQGMVGYKGTTYPTNYKYEYLAGAGNDMDLYITKYEGLPSDTIASVGELGYTDGYTLATISKAGEYLFDCDVYEGGSSGATTCEVFNNGVSLGSAYAGEARQTTPLSIRFNASVGDVITMQVRRGSYGAGSCKNITLNNIVNLAGIDNNRLNVVKCCVNDIYKYQKNVNWFNVNKYSARYYGYVCNEFIDINRYTKLLATIEMPSFSNTTQNLRNYNRGVALDRNKFFSKIIIGATQYSKDSKSNNFVGWAEFKVDTVDGVVNNVEYTRQNWVAGSNWSGSNISYFNALNLDIMGNVYGNYAYNGSNSDWFGLYPLWHFPGRGDQTEAGAISRNGMLLWGPYYYGYKIFHTDTPYNFSNYKIESVDAQYGNLMFSDDGMTMVSGNADWSLLTQYSLTTPRDISTATSTGKTLSIKGQVCLSSDCKYLFRFDDTTNTLYQYTYE